MTVECEQSRADVEQAGELSPMTLETARSLASVLAPHFAAMRAVTVGTRYARQDRLCPDGDPPVSPATTIFIAGMLERLSSYATTAM
jgi:hypothetical protein